MLVERNRHADEMSERLNFGGMLIGDRLRLLLDDVGAQAAIHVFDSCCW
jgi:hypothetical protein